MTKSQKVLVSVTTDLCTDQRVHKVCSSLQQAGYQVTVIGRLLPDSLELEERAYQCKRFRLWFNKGFLFYANYNISLFFYLLFHKFDVLLANDLDVLLANHLISKLKSKPLVYDSHEYFTEVPELVSRPKIQRFWERIERIILPKLHHCYTVTPVIAEVYRDKYEVDFKVIRNFPIKRNDPNITSQRERTIIYQGAINVGRGLEELIEAMQFLDAQLKIAGSGDIKEELQAKVEKLGLNEKVQFLGRIPAEELRKITASVAIGVSMERKTGLNYTYALPNKVFDYIHAGTPVIYSDLQEVKQTLTNYQIGEELSSYEPKLLAEQLDDMLNSKQYASWQVECIRASKEFNWQEEEQTLLAIFESI